MACAISCMRGVPASAAMTRCAVMTPYSTAITPHAMTAQRTDDIIGNLLFLKAFSTRSAPMKSLSPGAERAENDRTAGKAQQPVVGEFPVRSRTCGSGAGGVAQPIDADHRKRDADQGEGEVVQEVPA